MVFSLKLQELLKPDEESSVNQILDRSIYLLEVLSKNLSIITSIKQESQAKKNINSNIKNIRGASTPIVKRPPKMDKAIVYISYVTGKIVDPSLRKCESFTYRISNTGKLTFEKKMEHASVEHRTKKMRISFDNVSYKIVKPRLIKEICTSIQKSMKEHLKRKDYEMMYNIDASQQVEHKRRRHDQVEPNYDIVVPKIEPKIEMEDDSKLKIKNRLNRIITLCYPED